MSRNVSKFQQSAEDMVARIVGVPAESIAALVDGQPVEIAGITPGEILEWVEVIMQVVQTIMERCDKQRGFLLRAAQQTRLAHRVYARSVAHEVCCAREDRKWQNRSGAIAGELLATSSRMPAEQIAAIIDEVASPADNWLL